jgi:hypothetical protein
MNIEQLALTVAIFSGILIPIFLTAVFPWVLSINAKVAVIVEKLTILTERIEQDFREHEHMTGMLTNHARRLDDHEHRITVCEERKAAP